MPARPDRPRPWLGIVAGAVVVVAAAALFAPFSDSDTLAIPALVLVLPVMLAGVLGGWVAAVVVALHGGGAPSASRFIEPVGSFVPGAAADVVALDRVPRGGLRRRRPRGGGGRPPAHGAAACRRDRGRCTSATATVVAERQRLAHEAARGAVLEEVDRQRGHAPALGAPRPAHPARHDPRRHLRPPRRSGPRPGDQRRAPRPRDRRGRAARPDRRQPPQPEPHRSGRAAARRGAARGGGAGLDLRAAAAAPVRRLAAARRAAARSAARVGRPLAGRPGAHQPPRQTPPLAGRQADRDRRGRRRRRRRDLGERPWQRHRPRAARAPVRTVPEQRPGTDGRRRRRALAVSHGSTGIGLAICKAIVQAHGGTITVGDTPGGGARFSFTLPVVP